MVVRASTEIVHEHRPFCCLRRHSSPTLRLPTQEAGRHHHRTEVNRHRVIDSRISHCHLHRRSPQAEAAVAVAKMWLEETSTIDKLTGPPLLVLGPDHRLCHLHLDPPHRRSTTIVLGPPLPTTPLRPCTLPVVIAVAVRGSENTVINTVIVEMLISTAVAAVGAILTLIEHLYPLDPAEKEVVTSTARVRRPDLLQAVPSLVTIVIIIVTTVSSVTLSIARKAAVEVH